MNKLVEMLTENTGRHFLDSGSAYGRHWEKNQGVDFEAMPEGTLEFRNDEGQLEIDPILSVYHFLKTRLEYNAELDEQYREFADDLDIESAKSYVDSIGGKGIYGRGPAFSVNTTNGEDLLSQVLQYVYWEDEDDEHILLQIHGGCDIRGGYTDPVVFDVEEFSIFDNSKAIIYCKCGKFWDSDNGYHWVPDSGIPLEDYPATDKSPDYPLPSHPDQLSLFDDECKTANVGVIWVENERGHCPYCGGVLHLAPWPY